MAVIELNARTKLIMYNISGQVHFLIKYSLGQSSTINKRASF